MWQIGNAVPPRLAECIGYALIPYLNGIVTGNRNVVEAETVVTHVQLVSN